MKSDEALKQDVEGELLWDPQVDAANIRVNVHERVVTLSGTVPDYAQKLAAQKAVQRVAGSRALVMELDVPERPRARHEDEDLAAAIVLALRWQAGLAEKDIRVEVERGCVTLSGEVDWGYQRHAAEKVVGAMRGVVGVANQIVVRHSDAVADVAAQISAALARRAQREFSRIDIDVQHGVVTLTGTVASLAERRAACGAAWAAKGVRQVVDRLVVA
ncbi:BON domain-containing protein [Paraburkholderia caballeronis]|uniref:Osmotically-inducible protein OsmY, contains BON domain n=1 Tax=Paraburkholderia caballeronis TaxID=416943 RepID=A0A1H7RNN9_9BURK|nr:BON domain-containing protein [Paraburkholderia caballeronis]PXW23132.1 osmotically-inducible protein OsmY [Paraburkholderia caballeronis]PXW97796.1 osmotically-inducible protein OsmY [Paraburkholderia caballeronis]RAJ94766.1 osmotically-inducible protein OsmY [Paraburkholderia caballeronis]TDV11707.1 osmotically-inducible protein OsmY [Paraburkholderia caballeronis]TDV14788.1 osmotically-inducible protein OsmY [Paraburkholderia caballeronis]